MKRFLSILVCCAMLIGLMGPISTAAATASTTTHTTDIAVMGYNALNQPGVIENWAEYYTYNTRIERTVDIISRYDADSIGFQEVNYNIRNALNVMLKDYTMAPNMEMSSNAIFYRTDRMEVLESGVFWLSETPDYPSKYEDASEERTATYAVLRNKVTGVTYIHFNTHLDHISQTAVSYGMRVLRERIEAMRVKYPGIGIVAIGDFNMTRTHEAYDIMTSKWVHVDMQDSLFCAPVDQVYNEGATMINGYLTIEEDLSKYDGTLAIDHLFASIDELDVVSYKVMREGDKDNPQIAASDHFGVYVELNLGQGSVKRQPTETEILAAYGTAEIDGVMDDAYAASNGGVTKNLITYYDLLEDDQITSANYTYLYDENYLYYYIDVKDAVVTDAAKHTHDHTSDGLEIYYNFAKSTTKPTDYGAANGEAGYFRVYSDGYVASNVSGEYTAVLTETGYVIEGKIPLTESAKTLITSGERVEIGASFTISDDADNGANGERDYLLGTHDDVLAAWGNPNTNMSVYLLPNANARRTAPYGEVVVDGEMDISYTGAFGTINTEVLCDGGNAIPEIDRTSARWWATHDQDNLYYYIEVTDAHVTDADIAYFNDSNGAKAVDCVEIYYNYAKGSTNPTSYGAANGEAGYFTVFANGVDLVGGDAVALGSTYVAKHTDTGYVIEIAMPLTTDARIQLDAGNLTIGLAFVIHDDANNGVGGRDYVIVHDVDGGNSLASWSAPTYTSDVVLVKNQVSGQIATTGTVIVDGEKDHVFDLSTTGKIDNVIIKYNELLDESQETTATYSFARDDEYLYYYIDVTDYAVTPADIADFVDDNGGHAVDCIEIYYNFVRGTNSASNWGAVTGEAGYFTVFANGTDYIGGDSCSTYAAKHTDTGYVIEGRIPLSDSVKATLQAGENVNIGVAFQISDDADNGAVIGLYGRDYLIVSNSDVLSAWSNPASINTMILLEGDATAMPEPNQGGDDGEDAPEPVKTEFTVTLPDVEGLTITTDKETYKEGETVTLDIQLDEGYEFVQDAGLYDFGHWSNSSQRWKYFVSCVHGWYMMGRSLKADGQILIWSGNTFVMPDHDVEIIAEVEKIDTAVAQKNSVTLDGVKDEVYENSTAVEVNRLNESKTYFSAENPAHAYGTVTATYDNNYLYIFGEVTDPTKTTVEMVTNDVSSTTDLSLHGMDGITFYFDFLNTDTENVASNEYGFVEGESGLFVIDSLGLKTGNSGAVYNKLGAGFAAYNGDTDKADYVVVGTDTGYNVELKIALSDSVKAKLAAANAGDEIKIGFGAMILDDTHNNGGFDYENGDALICNSSLVANLWQATIFAHDAQGNLQVNCYASPRWMSTMTLVASETEECEHSWTSEVKEATCTEDGSVTYTCEHCGETYAETIEATGHSYVSEVKEATCTENGSVTYTCEHCGATYTETIEATGHNYENGTCTNCGAEKPSGEGDPADTGDAFSAMWILLLLVSMAGAAAMVLNRKKFVK